MDNRIEPKDDPENWTLYAFCVPGNHAGPMVHKVEGEPQAPSHWRYVKAQHTPDGWVYNPLSQASVMCCPHHHLDGEPANN